MQLPVA
ncbi:unnamed protein product [Linum tenue]|nr:unnamed protein product [Linum tenue]